MQCLAGGGYAPVAGSAVRALKGPAAPEVQGKVAGGSVLSPAADLGIDQGKKPGLLSGKIMHCDLVIRPQRLAQKLRQRGPALFPIHRDTSSFLL